MEFTSCTYVRMRVCMHVRTHGRSRTVLANKRKHKRTPTQINARKLIVAMEAWAISACKRDCDLRVRYKTFRMYYIRVRVIRPFVCVKCVRVYTIERVYARAYTYMRMHLYPHDFAFVYTHKCKRSFVHAYACVCVRVFTRI